NIAALAGNYTVYVPDLPGFGGSQPLDGDCYVPEFTKFVEGFSNSVGLDKFHLVGHSIGGGVALNYALEFPHKIGKLVLISSLCLGREIALWVRLLSMPARYIGSAILAVLRVVKWLVKALLAPLEFVVPLSLTSVNLGSSITTLKEQTLVLANRFSEIMMPTLVIWGAKEALILEVPKDPNKTHPYRQTELVQLVNQKLGGKPPFNTFDFQCIKKVFNITSKG
ncbi:unnamed protein product, partial [marine sediment metagenome]